MQQQHYQYSARVCVDAFVCVWGCMLMRWCVLVVVCVRSRVYGLFIKCFIFCQLTGKYITHIDIVFSCARCLNLISGVNWFYSYRNKTITELKCSYSIIRVYLYCTYKRCCFRMLKIHCIYILPGTEAEHKQSGERSRKSQRHFSQLQQWFL